MTYVTYISSVYSCFSQIVMRIVTNVRHALQEVHVTSNTRLAHCDQGVVCPQTAGGGDCVQIQRVAVGGCG